MKTQSKFRADFLASLKLKLCEQVAVRFEHLLAFWFNQYKCIENNNLQLMNQIKYGIYGKKLIK